MLVLTRKLGEKIHVGTDVVITVVRLQGDKVRLGIEAPAHVPVHREEVFLRDRREAGFAPIDSTQAEGGPFAPGGGPGKVFDSQSRAVGGPAGDRNRG